MVTSKVTCKKAVSQKKGQTFSGSEKRAPGGEGGGEWDAGSPRGGAPRDAGSLRGGAPQVSGGAGGSCPPLKTIGKRWKTWKNVGKT